MYIESATVTTSPHLYDNKIELVLTGASDVDCQYLDNIFKSTRHLGFIKMRNKRENKTMNTETRTFTATEFCRIEREAYDKGYKRGREVGRTEGFVDGRKASAPLIDKFCIGQVRIKKVIFNDPATIVFWADGTKTVAKAHGDDKFNKEVGLTVCIAKKALGNRRHFDAVFKKWIK